MARILLTALNARYTHANLALRYLYANLNELRNEACIQEFVIRQNLQVIAEKILEHTPEIIGLSVSIWNAKESSELTRLLKCIKPELIIVLGGPEVSYTPIRIDVSKADYIIQGEGEVTFYQLCKKLLLGERPLQKTIQAKTVALDKIFMPYDYYSNHDLEHRFTYIEASRGCIFQCEFCLSSRDEKVRYFDVTLIVNDLERLWKRGARNFKFIDRSFNLNIRVATDLLDFFLSKEPPFLVHFEVIPEAFPARLREKLSKFKPGTLQLEMGIQTLNREVAERIKRPFDVEKMKENLLFLETHTYAHLHTDLIVGLPGEDVRSFAKGLDALVTLSRSEIQVGVLKKLSGTPLQRHDETYKMCYSPDEPYDILCNQDISFKEMQAMKRFARFWDLAYNSGNFSASVVLLWGTESVFENFYAFSEWVYDATESTYQISLERFGKLLFDYLCGIKMLASAYVANALLKDFAKIRGRGVPAFLRKYEQEKNRAEQSTFVENSRSKRQIRHLS